MRQKATINREAIRFCIVGLTSNIVLYLLYLLFTRIGSGHKTAMTILFVIGIFQTYIFNKRWTFGHQGFKKSIFAKYALVYGVAYLVDLVGLIVFVDYLAFPHEIVQGILIILLAALLFIIQRVWVFCEPKPTMTPE